MNLTEANLALIADQRNQTFKTRRPVSEALEEILYTPFPVLDHGFIRVIDYMGVDESIVQAARLSYGRGTRKVSEDRGLINYLLRHRHTTPFEMCEIKYHVKLPIFVARQWIRHRTANVNEYSARYSILDNEFYMPKPEHLASQSKINRQGRGNILEGAEAGRVLQLLREDAMTAYDHYLLMLEEPGGGKTDESKDGLARELARMNLSLNFYTQWYWKIDLHNLFHFLSLRADPHAQYEVRAYAEIMLHETVKPWVPLAYDAFMNYVMERLSLSGEETDIIRRMNETGQTLDQKSSGLSKGEWLEFIARAARLGIKLS